MNYLISAESYRIIDDEIKKMVKGNNYILFNANRCTIKEIIEEASYFSLDDSKKWIVVSNADFFGTGKISESDNELLSKYLENSNETTNIIFTTLNGIDLRKKIVKSIKNKGSIINIPKMDKRNINSTLTSYLKNYDYSIDYKTLNYIMDNSYNNLDIMFNELDKIMIYYGFPCTIKYNDVLNIVGEEKTNNNIDDQIFPNELLAPQTQTIELTQTGAVDMVVAGLGALEAFNSAYTVFNLPYIMDSIEHYHTVMNDENIMGEVFNSTESSGFVGLTWFDARVRNIYTKNKVIQTPDDLKGLKIRVQTSPTNVKMLQALGASPTQMSFGEVYTGLQLGVIDGAENNELALVNNKHGEVAKVYSYNMHAMLPDILIISTSLLDRLTDEEKQIFIEAANIANEWEIKKWEQSVEEAKVTAEKMGVEFYYPDVKPFQDKMADLHAEYTQDENMKVIYDKIKAKGIEVAKAKEYEEDSVLEEREE